jgi:hypothetical protein
MQNWHSALPYDAGTELLNVIIQITSGFKLLNYYYMSRAGKSSAL